MAALPYSALDCLKPAPQLQAGHKQTQSHTYRDICTTIPTLNRGDIVHRKRGGEVLNLKMSISIKFNIGKRNQFGSTLQTV